MRMTKPKKVKLTMEVAFKSNPSYEIIILSMDVIYG